jgi:STE24 endopeptidase
MLGWMLSLVLAAYAVVVLLSFSLRWLNWRHLRRFGQLVPPELAGSVDGELLKKMSAYTEDRARLGLWTAVVSNAVLATFLFGGLLPRYDGVIHGLVASPVLAGVSFFLGLSWVESLISIPFGLYANFRIEARHGFNRMSAGLWWGDWLKGLLVSTVLMALAAAGAFALVQAAPQSWWLWVWALFLGLSVLLMYLSPILIEPLFFKLRPLEASGLEHDVRRLAERAGVHVTRVFTVDASRRSGHSNAYFTGIGRVKRVVLFDTLLDQLTPPQILGVLAHELGHWRKHHVLKRLALMALVVLLLAYLAFRLSTWSGLPGLVGATELSFSARILVLGFLGSLAGFVLTPLSAWWSRVHEREADQFASELSGAPGELANALVCLSRQNLANLHPHPLYAAFYYSHPRVTERVRSLRALEKELGERRLSEKQLSYPAVAAMPSP